MIDLHTHILPGVDDGAKSVEEAIGLLDMLEKQGVDTVVLTPHYYGRQRGTATFIEKRDASFARLKEAYRGPLKLLKGAECNISTCANRDYADLFPLCIGETNYLLTELSFDKKWSDELWRRIDELLSVGIVPIIAHAELYPAVIKKPKIARLLHEMGCMIQLNCSSFTQKNRHKTLRKIIGEVPYALGTDTHDREARPPEFAAALATIEREFREYPPKQLDII